MTKDKLKMVAQDFIYDMLDKWFPGSSIQDGLCKAAARTIIKAKIDSYDSTIDLFADGNGNILVDDFLDNFIKDFQEYRLDLTTFNIPILPRKILILSKRDLQLLRDLLENE